MRSASLVALAAGVTLAACSEPGSTHREVRGLEVRDSAGVHILDVRAFELVDPGAPREIDVGWSRTAEVEFGELIDLDRTVDGRTVVLDGLTAQIFVLTAEGRLASSFGGKGGGPGELEPAGLSELVLTDSSVLVPQRNRGVVSEFALTGEFLRNRRPPVTGFTLDWTPHPDGGLVYRVLGAADVLLHWAGQSVDTLFTFKPIKRTPALLLPPVNVWGLTHDGAMVHGRSDLGRIEATSGRNRLDWVVNVHIPDPTIGSAQRDALQSLLLRAVGRMDEGEVSQALLSQIQYPETTPIVAAVRTASNGRVWVQLAAPVDSLGPSALAVADASGYGGSTWLEISPDGSTVERVDLPHGFTPTRFFDGWIYGIAKDELGVQTPTRVKR